MVDRKKERERERETERERKREGERKQISNSFQSFVSGIVFSFSPLINNCKDYIIYNIQGGPKKSL